MASSKHTDKSKTQSRAKRGYISYESVSGRLRLVIPAKRSNSGKQERLALELEDTSENRAKAQKVVDIINSRIQTYDDYDPCKLVNYIAEGLGKSNFSRTTLNLEKVPQLDELWQYHIEFKKGIIRESSLISDYISFISTINKLSTKSLADAQKICDELRARMSYPSFYKYLHLISACCDRAVRKGKIKHNPFEEYCEELKAPKTDKEPDPFSRWEIELIIDTYRQHPTYSYCANYVEFKLLTGCRPGEGISLRWKNVDFKDGWIVFCESISHVGGQHIFYEGTKTEPSRKFPINDSPRLKELLENMYSSTNPDPEDFVFQDPKDGSHIKHNKFYNSWRGKRQEKTLKGGKKVVYTYNGIVYKLAQLGEENGGIHHYRPPYNTRHTFITLAVKKMSQTNQIGPDDVAQLAKYLGNSPSVIYKYYLGLSKNTSIVNIDVPVPDGSLSSIENTSATDAIKKLETQLMEEKQRSAALIKLLEKGSSVQSSETTSAPVTAAIAVSTPPSENLETTKSKKLRRTQPSNTEMEQLTIFSALAASITR